MITQELIELKALIYDLLAAIPNIQPANSPELNSLYSKQKKLVKKLRQIELGIRDEFAKKVKHFIEKKCEAYNGMDELGHILATKFDIKVNKTMLIAWSKGQKVPSDDLILELIETVL